jgi:hypothetical protein
MSTAASQQPDARDVGRATELDVKEVLACVQESLRDSGFGCALVLLLAQNEHDTVLTQEQK